MSDNSDTKKQPLPDTGNAPNSSEGSSSAAEPSAPQENHVVNETHSTLPARPPPPSVGFVYPQNTSQAPYPDQQVGYDAPPPSYQAAMSYPAAPTYGGTAAPEPKYYSGQPPTYYQPPPPPVITQTRLPQPVEPIQSVRTVRVQGAGVVVVQTGPNCRYCQMGVITRRNDMCCLLCLIILAIFTFPFGIIFLCCIPCTIQNRCTNCNRLG